MRRLGPRCRHEAKSLPARYYIDPDYYRSELEWFFFGMWIHAGRADEIPNPGDFVVRDVAGESLIVVRRDGGGLSAHYNVCRHRGTRLTEEKSGRFASTIQCPYHAWTYDLKGCLLAAPQMDRVAGFRLEDYPLHQAAVDLWDGHIFLNLGENPAPLAQQLGGLDERFRAWGMEQLRSGTRDRLRRRRQLEADHSQLFGMSALPGRPPGAAKTVALSERRE